MSNLYLLEKDTEAAFIGQLMSQVDSAGRKHQFFEIIKDNYDHFAWPAYREIYRVMFDLYNQGVNIDYPAMQEALIRAGRFKELGPQLLSAVEKARFAPDNYLAYAIIDHSVRRQAKRSLQDLTAKMDDFSLNTVDVIQDAILHFDQLLDKNIPEVNDDFSSAVDDKFTEIQDVVSEKRKISKFKLGFSDIDTLLGGFKPAELSIIAARPSVGKTAFAVNVMLNMAMDLVPSYFFSLEMGKSELISRMMSTITGIDNMKIRNYRLNASEIKLLKEASDDMKIMPIHLADGSAVTLSDIRMRCKRLKRTKGLNVVFVDYLQLIQPPKAFSREREIGIISSGLKAIAKDLDISMVALSQLNRSTESREDHEPKLSDLRDSGSIEQDADNVIFLHRPEMYKLKEFDDHSSTKNICEVIVAKQRNGPIGKAKLVMKKEVYSFGNYIGDTAVTVDGRIVNNQDRLLNMRDEDDGDNW